MRRALLLVDMQHDFLATPGLEPAPGELIDRAAELLRGCRQLSIPVFHVWTTVSPEGEDRMPHWRRAGRRLCVAGTAGHRPPAPLEPDSEPVVDKRWFSAFSNPELESGLREGGIDEVILCGVHLHGCVRTTALDAYQRGFEVCVAADAVGSYDGLHAAASRRYLEGRAARFAGVAELLARLGGGAGEEGEGGGGVSGERGADLDPAVARATSAGRAFAAAAPGDRVELLEAAATGIASAQDQLAVAIVDEIGKPRRYALAEVERAAELLRVAARAPDPGAGAADARVRRVPVGSVAQITPFNNPVAVPAGKLAGALRWGNSVVWKPSPAAAGVARRVLALIEAAGMPPGLISLLPGGSATAAALMADPGIDAVSITGSSAAGYAAQAICAERRVPLQAELGGNNAAIVWRDSDLAAAAAMIAEAGFGAAGQRCTANRRVIVDDACYEPFVAELESATRELRIGDPADPAVRIGPLVSAPARDRVAAAVERASERCEVREPVRDRAEMSRLAESAPFHPPMLVLSEDPADEIVREETFGPVVVIQRAAGFERALELLNGVRQGLVASLFTASEERRELFLAEARAGVLKLGRATADVGVEAPFGGWRASGTGPPEHGEGNREFYTRAQAIYGESV